MTGSATFSRRFHAWLSGNPDQDVLRWLFRCVVAVTIAVLGADLAAGNGWIPAPDPAGPETPQLSPGSDLPVPSILAPWVPGGDKRVTPLPRPDGAMAKPMTFELVGGGRLMATGTITPGISESFAAEVAKRGDYIKTVVLNSPGGSVNDALAMGRLIRDKKIATEVEAGKYCASSCPLVFAGGVERRAGDKAVIGVHQVAAVGSANAMPRDEMDVAQRISARCQRYLGEMGINLQAWVHAMETPHDRLFVFKPDELKSLNIVTAGAAPVAAPTAVAPAPKTRSWPHAVIPGRALRADPESRGRASLLDSGFASARADVPRNDGVLLLRGCLSRIGDGLVELRHRKRAGHAEFADDEGRRALEAEGGGLIVVADE